MNEDFIVYILYYDEDSKKKAQELFSNYAWAKLIFNRTDKYLESNAYQYLLTVTDEWMHKKYVGCLGINVCKKINQSVDYIENFIKENMDKADVLTFIRGNHTLDFENNQHGDILKYLSILTNSIDNIYTKDWDKIIPFYCNYWLAKPHIMLDYCKFINNVIEIIETSNIISQYLDMNAGYKIGQNRIFTKPYYTWHPFICERLPCIYFYHKNYTIIYDSIFQPNKTSNYNHRLLHFYNIGDNNIYATIL